MRLSRSVLVGVGAVICFLAGAFLILDLRSSEANELFGNMTYMTNNLYIAEKVTLINGHRETVAGLLHHSMHYDGEYIYGDFNHDGLKDAAVVITQGEGAGENFRSLAFLIRDGKQFVHKKSASLGGSVIINSLKERNGKVVVDMFIHQNGDCMAGPTCRVKKIFEYGGDGVWIKGKQKSIKSVFDPIILIFKTQAFTYTFERFQLLWGS